MLPLLTMKTFNSCWLLLLLFVCASPRLANAAVAPSYLDFCLRSAAVTNGVYIETSIRSNDQGELPFNGQQTISTEIEYHQPLNEKFSLIWSPLPLGILYRVDSSEAFQSVVAWNLGLVKNGRLGINPRFDSFSRKVINDSTDVEFNLEYGTFAPFDSRPEKWSLSLAIGPRLALTSELSIIANLGVSLNAEKDFSTLYPVALGIDWAAFRNSKSGFEYLYRGLFQHGGISDVASLYLNAGW